MKKINFIKIALIAAFLPALLSSCKKVLEQEPKNSPYAEVYWKTARDCRSAIAGNYSLLRDAVTDKNNRYYMYGDAIAQNYFTIKYNGDGLEGIQGGNFTFNYNVESLGDWKKYYKAIAMANIAIKEVGKIDAASLADEVEDPAVFKNSIIGQAYFIRALSYFMMARVWGDVPLVTEAYDDPISAPNIARTPVATVLKQVEDDCHAAAALLGWRYEDISESKVTANKGSVYALLAHLYMWRGTMSDISTDAVNLTDINSADTTINQIMTNGGYTYTDTANYYSTFIKQSPESIFEINMSEDNLEGSASHIGREFLDGEDISNIGDYHRFFVTPQYLSNHYYSNDPDIRFKKNFTFKNGNEPILRKYHNVTYRNQSLKQDPYLSNNMIIFRLSDMKLLQAEIAIYKGEYNTAVTIINSFRIKNGTFTYNYLPSPNTLSREDLLYEYILERGKELYVEGHIFYDLLRTRMYKYFVNWLPDDEVRFKRAGFYWPVNPKLFKNNPLLTQTTYWVGKI